MIVLFYDAITLSRYIFIFWLKNPTAVEDSFWSLFINIWIVTGCTIFAAVNLFTSTLAAGLNQVNTQDFLISLMGSFSSQELHFS